jgi:hypothetical protein
MIERLYSGPYNWAEMNDYEATNFTVATTEAQKDSWNWCFPQWELQGGHIDTDDSKTDVHDV